MGDMAMGQRNRRIHEQLLCSELRGRYLARSLRLDEVVLRASGPGRGGQHAVDAGGLFLRT
jgi:hypothetical protein